VIEPLRLEIARGQKRRTFVKERLMNAPTSAAAARKPLAVKSELEAEISNLLEQEGQKPPDDGERIRSLVARLTSNSIDELEGLGSDLTSAVRELQEFLKSEGERVQREIVNYAHLTETTLAAIKTIIETTFRPAHRATSTWVDSKRAP
jgi:gas vesicle protein